MTTIEERIATIARQVSEQVQKAYPGADAWRMEWEDYYDDQSNSLRVEWVKVFDEAMNPIPFPGTDREEEDVLYDIAWESHWEFADHLRESLPTDIYLLGEDTFFVNGNRVPDDRKRVRVATEWLEVLWECATRED